MPRIDRHTLLFSANSFAAAMLALYIALALGLPRPYWALTTAYIVSQPLSGAVRSKAVYRVLGTLLGAAATVALVPSLVNSPLLLSLAMAFWVSACLVVSLLDRTPKSYVLMLAGYTAALIGFPSVTQPDAVFEMATSRVVEIGLGILCAALVHSLVFPRAVGDALQGRLAAWVADADRWLADLLSGADDEQTQRSRSHLAAAASEIHILAAHLPFDTSRLRDTTASVRALHDRMLMLLPLLSGLADRLAALSAQGGPPPRLLHLLDDSRRWLAQGADPAAGKALAARIRTWPAAGTADWNALLADSLRARLADTVGTLGEAHALLAHLARPAAPLSPELAKAVGRAVARPLHKDLPLALRSGATALVAIMITCGLWIGLGWPDGATAAMMTAVFCCFYASLDDPAPAIADFGVFSLMGLPLAALYLFAIMPAISGFPMLVAALAPVLLIVGLYVGDAKTSGKAMPVVMAFCSALALQESFSADFASFLNANLAQFVGIFVAIFATRAMRSISAEASVRRLVARTWAAIGRLGRGATPEPAAFAAVLVDRIALLSPKLAAAGVLDHVADEALRDLRVAMNLMSVRQAGAELPARQRAGLESVVAAIAEHYGELPRHGRAEPAAALREHLDATLEKFVGDATAEPAVMGLVGLRQNLFPNAPPARLEAA